MGHVAKGRYAREARQREATARQEARDSIDDKAQLQHLKREGYTALKEVTRLNDRIAGRVK